MKDCIAAIATALSPAGIGAVRLSGKDSLFIVCNFFKGFKDICNLKGYEAAYGNIVDDGVTVDDGIIIFFKAPKSYTGEDVVEIFCHGGPAILDKVLKLCFKFGASPAKNGEFTKRAFLNGKMKLTQAEAVMDIVSADSYSFLKAANNVKNGLLYKTTTKIKDKLVEIAGKVAVYLDYPEDDIEDVDILNVREALNSLLKDLKAILEKGERCNILKDGVRVVLAGRPNVGKSTLMNMLCGEEVSIVTKFSGTTRDVVKETFNINGVNFTFCDTAGIRDSEDVVEKKGIEKAKKSFNKADILIFVTDDRTKKEDIKILDGCECLKKILVYNKSDLGYEAKDFSFYGFDAKVSTSSKKHATIEKLKEVIYNVSGIAVLDSILDPMLLNQRQQDKIKKTIDCLNYVIDIIKKDVGLDIISVYLEEAIEHLLELSGEKVSDVIIEEIFSKFCVGK